MLNCSEKKEEKMLSDEKKIKVSRKNIDSNDCFLIASKNELKGVIDTHGNEITEFVYSEISKLSAGYFAACKLVEGKKVCGFVSKKGEEYEFQYDNCFPFENDFAAVKKKGKWGFVNQDFKIVIPLKFDNVLRFSEGFVEVMQEGKWGFIDIDGRYLVKPTYEETWEFQNGFAMIKKDGKYGFIDKDGNEAIKPLYNGWRLFSKDKLALVNDEKRGWKIIDSLGNEFPEDPSLRLMSPSINEFSLVKVRKEISEGIYKYGYLDLKGNEMIPIEYDEIGSMYEVEATGAGKYNEDGKLKYCLVTSKGKELTGFKFDHVHYFYEGPISIVRNNLSEEEFSKRKIKVGDTEVEYFEGISLSGAINEKGEIVIPIDYHRLSPIYSQQIDDFFNQCLFTTQKIMRGNVGIINDKNKHIQMQELFNSI